MSAPRLLASFSTKRSARKLAISTGIFRTLVGSALLARPATLARLLGVDSTTSRRTEWLTRMLAGRETALGLGSLHVALTGRPVRPWLLAQALSDACDAAALVRAARSHRIGPAPAAALVTFATAGVLGEALTSLERQARPDDGPA